MCWAEVDKLLFARPCKLSSAVRLVVHASFNAIYLVVYAPEILIDDLVFKGALQ